MDPNQLAAAAAGMVETVLILRETAKHVARERVKPATFHQMGQIAERDAANHDLVQTLCDVIEGSLEKAAFALEGALASMGLTAQTTNTEEGDEDGETEE